MSFIRPDAARAIRQWRETLVGVVVLVLGLLWVFGRPGILQFLGYPVCLIGIIFILIGIQRARFRTTDDGAGAVQVDEGQITYFGPLTGGATALADMERLTLDRSLKPAHWRLDSPGTPALLIPVNAVGSDALFDAFATLPGLRTERMLTELNASQNQAYHQAPHQAPHQAVVIWERTPLRPAHIRLH